MGEWVCSLVRWVQMYHVVAVDQIGVGSGRPPKADAAPACQIHTQPHNAVVDVLWRVVAECDWGCVISMAWMVTRFVWWK